MERGWKPNVEFCPPCPRCGSSSTKFCYYNNYSLTQPRYFCKGCRRYWTKGGSLRNIPVGGGCRKARRAKSIRISDTVNSQNFLAHGGGGTTGSYVENHSGGGGATVVQPTSTIDLQQVYASFVSQRPQSAHDDHEQRHDDLMAATFGFPNMEMEFGGTNYGSNLESNFLSEGNSGMQFCGYNSVFTSNNCGLPPLPGEELGWSDSNIGFPEHVLNSTIEPEGGVSGGAGDCNSVKMFDHLPLNADTIFRPSSN